LARFKPELALERAKKLAIEADNECSKLHGRMLTTFCAVRRRRRPLLPWQRWRWQNSRGRLPDARLTNGQGETGAVNPVGGGRLPIYGPAIANSPPERDSAKLALESARRAL
jgi:hypothetical protein